MEIYDINLKKEDKPLELIEKVEVREEIEHVNSNAPVFKLPPELIEGRRRLYIYRDDIMVWLRLKRINKLDCFIRNEYIRIYENLIKIRKDLTNVYNKAQDKLPYTYFEYGDEEYDDSDEENKQLFIDLNEKYITLQFAEQAPAQPESNSPS
ncbi:7538_t:CDS:2 [Entrophospora sp. SA101]|nr:7538_t:CDS:2 [Entrophospora sp. SA101]